MHFSCSIFRFFQNGSWNNGCIRTSGNVWICSFDCCVDLWKTFCHQITSSCKSFLLMFFKIQHLCIDLFSSIYFSLLIIIVSYSHPYNSLVETSLLLRCSCLYFVFDLQYSYVHQLAGIYIHFTSCPCHQIKVLLFSETLLVIFEKCADCRSLSL